MKVNFIIPSWHHLANPFLHQPYWELYHATLLNEKFSGDKDFELTVTDLRSNKDHINKVQQSDIYLYWIFKTADAIECYEHVKILKKSYPNSKHIAGGTHVETMREECSKNFDAIIIGPGEPSFYKSILDNKKNDLKKIYSESWRDYEFKNYSHAERSFIESERITNHELFSQYGKLKATMTYFSRGCMFNCAFCTLNILEVYR